MLFSITAILPILLAAKSWAADCSNAPGVANGACVKYYSNGGCNGSYKLGQYKPTCAGNCFQYDQFHSLHVGGDGTYGTDCHVFSDINCTNRIAVSGNVVTGPGKCINTANAKSMKCYYRC